MKKIILIIFISLMFSNIGVAEIRFIEKTKIFQKSTSRGEWDMVVSKICVDGYVFVTTYDGFLGRAYGGVTTSITQVFEERDGKSLPAKC